MANLKISGITTEDARIKVMDDDIYIGYKDVVAGAYQIVFPDQRPNIDPDDDFTGTNGDPPDDTKWQIIEGAPDIQSNNLSMVHAGGSVSRHELRSRFVLTGDFHIRFLANLSAVPAANWSYIQMNVYDLGRQNGFTTQIRSQSDGYQYINRTRYDNGVYTQTGDTYMGAWDAAGVALIRSGSSFGYYANQSGVWYFKSWEVSDGMTGDVKVDLISNNAGSFPALTNVITEFEMVSGEVVVAGTWPVHVYGVSDRNGDTIGYGDVESVGTSDPIDINEWI